jgi:uncharacterized protein YfaS (alpha-2-macroglobulin family)
LQERATTAAYLAYQRATTRADEAAAIAVLGEIYAQREMWRPALTAFITSLQLADSPALRKTYDELREKHGFRLIDYKVDSDAASPRTCFQFSEPLASKVDFTPFVAVSGAANAAVTAENTQLCVEGLKHGERYAFVIRQGLPSSVGENLLKSADYEVYVRDRSPRCALRAATMSCHAPARKASRSSRSTPLRSRSTFSASATATSCRLCAPTSSCRNSPARPRSPWEPIKA